MNTVEIKKAFAKAIAAIRNEGKEAAAAQGFAHEYPKAMMTGAQMNKGTGTVNCGWKATRGSAYAVLNHPSFTDFLKKTGAKAEIEQARDGMGGVSYQVRIMYTAGN